MTDACGGGEHAAAPTSSLDASDPELYYEEEEEEEKEESEPSDTSSIFSDDSVYPCYELSPGAGGAGDLSLYQCCARNDAKLVKERLEHGVTRSEATELDVNGRNGLMVACYKGFIDIVPLLQKCPYINVNQQDKDGNTALMMAAQAGHITIVNYLLNYYPALEVDKRDPRGLTALMKAAVQGRHDCVAALLLAGADLQAVDPIKGKTAREWAAFTGRFETTVRIRSLLQRPRAEQFGSQYRPEWPALAELVARALSPKSRGKRLSEKIQSMFTFSFPHDPKEDGVMDHMHRCILLQRPSHVGDPAPATTPAGRWAPELPAPVAAAREHHLPWRACPKNQSEQRLLPACQLEGAEAEREGQEPAAATQVEVQGAEGGEESSQGGKERGEKEERGEEMLSERCQGGGKVPAIHLDPLAFLA
ncbi:photoreceptor ankyrin repeat protein isoform X2 [Aquila chrysaetos chrysaetos]|uniref:photoreceptor ankyrin repeat protein isoform X2 n=1 Tax=Aquila chrysaetos chrysaetos TaxID=223781 RepID=UPI001176BD20|nr:photoreceptor ankyrin repeat protein isoform X2 [Aquila chrysaetos chrysaetos]